MNITITINGKAVQFGNVNRGDMHLCLYKLAGARKWRVFAQGFEYREARDQAGRRIIATVMGPTEFLAITGKEETCDFTPDSIWGE